MKNQKNFIHKEDMFLKITAAQLIVAISIFLVIFGISKTNESLFYDIKLQFSRILSVDFDYNDFVPFNEKGEEANQNREDNETQNEEVNVETQENPEETSEENLEETSVAASGGEDLSIDEGLEIINFEEYTASENAVYPVNGRVTSEFGYRIHPIYGTRGLHSGKDIAASEGTNIYCALDGEVIETGVGEKSGNYVKVDHGNGIVTLYAHCKEILVSEGINVRKGEVIALVGATGLVTGPHLHFEVIINGEKSDPDYLLEDAIYMKDAVLCVSE